MVIKKRFMALFLVVTLLFTVVHSDYKQVQAFPIGIPIAVIFVLVLGAVCVSSGVSVDLTNPKQMINELAESMHTSDNNTVYDWFEKLAKTAVIAGGTQTLMMALQAGNAISQLDLKQFIVPIGEVIKLTNVIKNFIVNFICQKLGINELKAGVVVSSDLLLSVKNVLIQHGINDFTHLNDVLQYNYITIFENAYDDQKIYVYGCNNLPILIGTDTYMQLYFKSGSGLKRYINYSDGVESFESVEASSALNYIIKRKTGEVWTPEFTSTFIYYNNYDLKYGDVFIIESGYHEAVIPNTVIDNLGDTDLDTIPIDNGLADKAQTIDIDNAVTTDDIMLPVIDNIVSSVPKTTTDIWDKIKDLPGTIAEGISAGLSKVFIPDQAKVTEFVDTVKNNYEEKLGILYLPTELVIKFLNGVNELGNNDCIITFPKIEWMGHIINEDYQFNLSEYVERPEYQDFYHKYLMIVNAIMIISVVWLAKNKGEELLTGGLRGD